MPRHFLTVADLTGQELVDVLDLADELKASRPRPGVAAPPPFGDALAGSSVALIFEKPSTRTRVSFEVAVRELGGHPLVLSSDQLQLGRGETVEDTARVLSRFVHAIVIRTFGQDRLEALATAGSVPVVNALSDAAHPCQAVADLQTIRQYKGGLAGLRLAYLGDGNNVAHSLLRAGALAGMQVSVATPPGYAPDPAVVAAASATAGSTGGRVTVTTDPWEAVTDADAVYTDVWASMGQEDQADARAGAFTPYQVNREVVDAARPDAIVLHCLPAHRGEEITADVIDGDHSVVWSQAENRLHAQKALLLFLLLGTRPRARTA